MKTKVPWQALRLPYNPLVPSFPSSSLGMTLRAKLQLRAARSPGMLEHPRQVHSQAEAWERGRKAVPA